MNKTFFKTRKWLNPIKSSDTGWLQAEVTADYFNVSASFTVADCSRQSTLDFDIYGSSDFKERIKKVDILIKELYDFRCALEKAYAHHIQEKVKQDAKHKK